MKKITAIILCSLILTGCSSNFNNNLEEVVIDGKKFFLEVVQSESEREKGLMHRKSLSKDRGMLFVFEKSDYQTFWMKNTFIPLQILFINGCKIVDIQQMSLEKNPDSPRKKYISKFKSDKAIELNAYSVPESIIGQKISGLCN